MADTSAMLTILARWSHVTSGVFWIGLLYYFNVVQVPVFKRLDAATRSNNVQKLVPVALAWFRYSALSTVVFGLILLYLQGQMTQAYLGTPQGVSISAGMLLGLIMALNVWVIIWPNQKKVIQANVDKASTGKDIPAESAKWAKSAFYASRVNFVLSFPMLYFMTATTHFAGGATQMQMLGLGGGILILAAVALWFFTSMGTAPKPQAATPPSPSKP